VTDVGDGTAADDVARAATDGLTDGSGARAGAGSGADAARSVAGDEGAGAPAATTGAGAPAATNGAGAPPSRVSAPRRGRAAHRAGSRGAAVTGRGAATTTAAAVTGPAGVTGAARSRSDAAGRIPERLRARRATALVVGAYLVGAVTVWWNAWSNHPTTTTQFGGDQAANVWYLAWATYALRHGVDPFFTTFANHPFGVNLVANTSCLLLGVAVSPVTVLFGPVASFNTVMTLSLVASALAAYALVHRFVRWRFAAFVGGLLYGFGPFAIAEAYGGHQMLVFAAFPPLILLVWHEIAVRQRRSARSMGVVLALLLVGQFFVSSEVLVSTVLIAAVATVATAVVDRQALRGKLGGVLLAYPAWYALEGQGAIHGPIQLVPEAYRADLLGPIVPDLHQRIAPAHLAAIADKFANSTTENGSYLGVTLLLVLLVGTVVLWRRSAVVRVAALTGTGAFVLSLGSALAIERTPDDPPTGIPLPDAVLAHLPLVTNGVPSRFAEYAALFAGLLLAVVLEAVYVRVGSAPGEWAAADAERRRWERQERRAWAEERSTGAGRRCGRWR
jgi:hypothetical protein